MFADPVGDRMPGCSQGLVEVDDGFDRDGGAGVGAPGLQLLEQGEALALLEVPGGSEDRGGAVGGGVEVGVQDDFPCDWESVASGSGGGRLVLTGVALVEEVEGGLSPGEVAEGFGPAGVEGQLGAEGLLDGGAVGEGAVEVESVGEVEIGLDVQGAGEVDVVGVDGGVAGVDVLPPVLRIGGRIRGGELEASDGFDEEAVELCGADPPGDCGDLGVDPPGSLGGEGGGGVDCGLGDEACPPGGQPARPDLRPQPREAVA